MIITEQRRQFESSQQVSLAPITVRTLILSLLAVCSSLTIAHPANTTFAQSLPMTIEFSISPCPISEPPATLIWIDRPLGENDVALEHRQAMLDAWNVLIQRNTIPAFDEALQRQPKIGASDALPWRFGMVEYFKAPIHSALAASKKGRAPFIEPLRREDQSISIVPPNGANTLAPQFFNWLLVQQELEEADSILMDLPLVLTVFDDWLEGEDTFFDVGQYLTRGLLQLAVESPGPNLGPALQSCPSPYRSTRNRFAARRQHFLFGGYHPQSLIQKISDLAITDSQVLDDCQRILTDAYQRQLRYGIYWEPTLEQWLDSLQSKAESHRSYLIKTSGMEKFVATAMHPYRLALLAAMAQYDAFAKLHEELLALPVHEAVARWHEESEAPTKATSLEYWKPMGQLSRSFCYFYAQQHWYAQQGIHATSILYFLRHHLAIHGSLPTSLQLLPTNSATIDPITNQPFQYERASADQATLQLSNHRGGVRQIWKISVQQDTGK